MNLRSSLLIMVVMIIFLSLIASSLSVASCELFDEDRKTSTYSQCYILLSKRADTIATEDFYNIDVYVSSRIRTEDLLPNPEWSGPIITDVYVYLPSNASDIRVSPSQGTSLTTYERQGLRFEPKYEELGNFVRVYWSLSSEHFDLAKGWPFIDTVAYSASFIVPENASVTAFAYIHTVSYSYRGVYYSQLADESCWLTVKNANETVAQPQLVGNAAPAFLVDVLGVDMIMAIVFSGLAVWHFRRSGRVLPAEFTASQQETLKVRKAGGAGATFGTMVLAAVVGFLGFLEVFVGGPQLDWYPPLAVNLLVYGLASIVVAIGLFLLKPWGWYAAVGLMAISIIDHYFLFPAFTGFMIPLEPFILIYLLFSRKQFPV